MTNNTARAPRQPQRRHPRTLPPRRLAVCIADWPYRQPGPCANSNTRQNPSPQSSNPHVILAQAGTQIRTPPLFRQKKRLHPPSAPGSNLPPKSRATPHPLYIYKENLKNPHSKISNPQSRHPPLNRQKRNGCTPRVGACQVVPNQPRKRMETGGCRIAVFGLRTADCERQSEVNARVRERPCRSV
jgi:hypothetical protein